MNLLQAHTQTEVTGRLHLSRQHAIKPALLTESGHPDLDSTPPDCFSTFLLSLSVTLSSPSGLPLSSTPKQMRTAIEEVIVHL